MSEASLSRILAGGANIPPVLAALSDWLELVTADAIAKNRCNIIQFPIIKRKTTNDDADTSKPAA